MMDDILFDRDHAYILPDIKSICRRNPFGYFEYNDGTKLIFVNGQLKNNYNLPAIQFASGRIRFI